MAVSDLPADVRDALAGLPEPAFVEAFIVDINGIARGKRLPAEALSRLYEKGLNLPGSTPLLDIWGEEVEATGLALATGDADRVCMPVAHSLRPMPWCQRPALQTILTMQEADGRGFAGDPRAVLSDVVARLTARGLTAVVATELEFRLFEAEPDATGRPVPARRATGPGRRSQLFGLDEIENLDAVFGDIEAACRAQNLPMDTLIAEQGEAQYEINLEHVADPLLAADQTLLLKRTIKGVAARHSLTASFMAKPFGDSSGNGMHAHVSLIDAEGRNVFANDDGPDSPLMRSVAGLLDTMAEATAIFAPHENSYRRLLPGSHAPNTATWGIDNRTTAVRLPLAPAEATRIEHRVAGADANPYLVLAAVLAGMEHGLAQNPALPAQTVGDAYDQPGAPLPNDWGPAIEAFADSAFIGGYFSPTFQGWFAAAKRQERARLRRIVARAEHDAYLRTV